MLKFFRFNSSDFCGDYYTLEVTFPNTPTNPGTIEFLIRDYKPEGGIQFFDYVVNVSINQCNSFERTLLDKCHLFNWKEHYSSYVLDGEQWEIKYILEDGTHKNISGSNAYPKEWKILEQSIDTFIATSKESTPRIIDASANDFDEWFDERLKKKYS